MRSRLLSTCNRGRSEVSLRRWEGGEGEEGGGRGMPAKQRTIGDGSLLRVALSLAHSLASRGNEKTGEGRRGGRGEEGKLLRREKKEGREEGGGWRRSRSLRKEGKRGSTIRIFFSLVSEIFST